MSLSRFWQQQDRQAEARALLAPVYDWFTQGFDTADHQKELILWVHQDPRFQTL